MKSLILHLTADTRFVLPKCILGRTIGWRAKSVYVSFFHDSNATLINGGPAKKRGRIKKKHSSVDDSYRGYLVGPPASVFVRNNFASLKQL